MTEAAIDTRYLSAGANRYAAAADWGENGLLAFGADINVCLWNPSNTVGISKILSGHTAHVRAVKFLPRLQDEKSTYLVSGGDDQSLRVWAVNGETGAATCVQTLQEHTAPINYLAALKIPVGSTKRRIFVSGAADSTVKVWSLDVSSGQATLLQTIKTAKKYFPLALALSPLNDEGTALILAVAGTTNIIQIFTASTADDTQLEFTPQATLPGHENWIRSLDFIREKQKSEAESDILLASSSQDKYIRIWRIHQGSALSMPTSAASDASAAAAALTPGPANKIHKIKVEGADPATNKYCIMFEALLLGHEDWIYTARWCRSPTSTTSDSGEGTLQLLSASADNSLSIWESDSESGIWITVARLGEVSREKGATTATGSIGGFWTGMWSPSGTTVITLGRTGSWRRWDWDTDDQAWKQNFAVSGHTRAVTGISWSRNGVYLLSTSSDQTTRLHAEWAATNPFQNTSTSKRTWHEMARPQIHGYDLNCIDSLSSTSFVSGADEKLMRVFTEPKAVARMLTRLTGTSSALSSSDFDSLPADAANIPVLGLSNKAIDVIDDDADASAAAGGPQDGGGRGGDVTMQDRENMLDPASMVRKSALEIDHPPFEESLSRHTLWPEVEKLYGHGYEISCLAVSHPSSSSPSPPLSSAGEKKQQKETHLIASACRAASLNHAVIRLFETDKWTELRPPLKAHTSTIHRLRFSPHNTYLLSVGKDRQWAVFQRDSTSSAGYTLLQLNPKGHARMILDAAWAPKSSSSSGEGGVDVFATAGRDKAVKIWVRKPNKPSSSSQQEGEEKKEEFTLGLSLTEDQPITALDFASEPLSVTEDGSSSTFLLAVGTESGKLSVLAIKVSGNGSEVSVAETFKVGEQLWLPKAVMQLAWRPRVRKGGDDDGDEGEKQAWELAIAGEDGSLRIYEISL